MKRYQQQSNVSTIAVLGAVIATAATIGIAVLLPTKLPQSDDTLTVGAAAPTHRGRAIAVIAPIEVIGYRTERAATQNAAAKGGAVGTAGTELDAGAASSSDAASPKA